MTNPIKVWFIGIILMVISMLLCSCAEKPEILDKNRFVHLTVVSKQSVHMKDAIQAIKDSMEFFRKDNRCFSVIMFRVGDGYTVASVSEINCNDYR